MEFAQVGSVLAGHRIDGVIGQGGMGIVYRATHLRLEREVALKVISPALADDSNFRERFKRESKVAASLRHPHIVTIYDAGEDRGLLYITMEYVVGQDLQGVIRERGKLEPARAVMLIEQVGSALSAAHSRGLVHRDVKPANVLIQGEGGSMHAYLTDFGLTRHASSVGGLTRTGQWVGTIDYVAPEQLEGAKLDGRADIYSLGCMLFETLTGRVPFDRENELAKLWAHVNEPPPLPSETAKGVPVALDGVVAAALTKDRDERFANADELAAAARKALSPGKRRAAPRRPKAKPAAATVPAGGKRAKATRAAAKTPATKEVAGTAEARKTEELAEGSDGRGRGATTRPGGRRLAVAAVTAMLLAAGVGSLLSPSSDDGGRVSAGNVSLTTPAGWERDLSGGRAIDGLELEDTVALNYEPLMGQGILRAGALGNPGSVADPLPEALVRRFRNEPESELVDLRDSTQGLLYEGETRGGDLVEALLVATSEGYQAVACEAPAGEFDVVSPGCQSAMATLEITGADPFSPVPDEELASELSDVFAEVSRARAQAAGGLSSRKPAEQLPAAEELAAAYSKAASSVSELEGRPQDAASLEELRERLGAVSDSYEALEEAARARDPAEHSVAQRRIDNAAAGLGEALDGLAAIGYRLRRGRES